jgi:hypothetical protein
MGKPCRILTHTMEGQKLTKPLQIKAIVAVWRNLSQPVKWSG